MSKISPDTATPPGMTLRHCLRGHKAAIFGIAWSPDGRFLASASADGTVRLWESETGALRRTQRGGIGTATDVAFSPDGKRLAFASSDGIVLLWDLESGKELARFKGHFGAVQSAVFSQTGSQLASASEDTTVRVWDVQLARELLTLHGHRGWVWSVAFSPDGKLIASGSSDRTARIWDAGSGRPLVHLLGHIDRIWSVAFSPDGKVIATGSWDRTVRIWEVATGLPLRMLEGHLGSVTSARFSADGRLIASKSTDHTIRLWRCDTWLQTAVLPEPASPHYWTSGLAFHPSDPAVLATLGEHDTVIRIWDLDLDVLLSASPPVPTVHYTNAKIILVGDTGVGKTGLGLVLNGREFTPTDSTHGRNVWTFDTREVDLGGGREETRETLLWDLAGQPGYRLVHQLHLDEVTVAAIVFDARSETDPLAGVRHWDRALRQSHRLRGDSALPLKRFLVCARTDRGGAALSPERIKALVQRLGFDGYFETSAKEGRGVEELAAALRDAIDWDSLPKVSSTQLFQDIKAFLLDEKQAGRLLSPADDLYRAFLNTTNAPAETDDLRPQFDTCLRLVESRGLLRRLSFGDLVLLQPERLDSYASALVNAARGEPQGLGCIPEELVLQGRFQIPKEERLPNAEQEKLLLIAMVEDLLRHEIALREYADDGPLLIFPSQFTRDYPDAPEPHGKAVIFDFEGPIANIYSTLCVRLAHSGLCSKKEMWRNAALYTAQVGGECGLWLREIEEGRAELTLFFGDDASEETRFGFEEYVRIHLQRRALPDTITRRRIFVCPECETPISDLAAQRRRERGHAAINCPVCETQIPLLDREERLVAARAPAIAEMDRSADTARDRAVAATVMEGKEVTHDFDVFIAHHTPDKPQVEDIADRLKARGINPWIDKEQIPPGRWFQDVIQDAIPNVESAAIFIGMTGLGKWEIVELRAFISQCVDTGMPVIPVLLPGVTEVPKPLLFLKELRWVRFDSLDDDDALDELIWGITGEHPARLP